MNDRSPENRSIVERLTRNIDSVIRGQSAAIRKLLAAFISGGHVLLEDVPGTGKTTLAKALTRSIDADFKRIQFTPDLLPSDILGVSVYSQKDQTFHFHKGPVFTNILLADEINRASPRTQSALLESMAEGQVSQDGTLWNLEPLFFVIATQNPVESRGTYPLPEAQMDRFAFQFSLGYVSMETEVEILGDQQQGHPLDNISAVATKKDILALRTESQKITMTEELKKYVVALVSASRTWPGVQLGASPRASLAIMRTAKTLALFDGLDFVIPDHIQEVAEPIMAHRLVLDPQARFSGVTSRGIVTDIVQSIAVPT